MNLSDKEWVRCFVLALPLAAILLFSRVSADVIRDGSIGVPNNIQPLENTAGQIVITQLHGEIRGANLFHSFSEFNLNNNQSALFTDTRPAASVNTPIQNVISRITGNSVSSIDGNISSDISNANIYLINPRGFVFGNNASINIPGSFYVSSADSLNFTGNEAAFVATSTGYVPVLATAMPAAFGFLNELSGDIRFDGAKLISQQGVSIHASNIEMNNNAQIDLLHIGVQDSGIINLTAGENISLNNSLLESRQDINLNASFIEMRNNARIKTSTSTSRNGGNINLNANDAILLSGKSLSNSRAVLYTETRGQTKVSGSGGDITLTAPVVEVLNGAQIMTNTSAMSTGNGGDIAINATGGRVEMSGRDSLNAVGNSESLILTAAGTNSTGQSGSISISSNSILMADGARIVANTQGSGAAGDIQLDAISSLTLDGFNSNKNMIDTDISAGVSGSAGDIRLSASKIAFINGAKVASRTEGSGDGGNISLSASESIVLEGTAFSGGTLNASATGLSGQSNAGTITVNAPTIILSEGAKINSSASNANNGGDIIITATDSLSLSGENVAGNNAQLSASTASGSTGRTGNIIISAGDIYSDAGIITTSTQGSGAGGDINISTTGELSLVNNSVISSSSLQTGDAGNIDINVNNIRLKNSTITTESLEAGGGNIRVVSKRLLHLQNNSIINSEVSAGAGNSGDINIEANFVLLNDSSLLAGAREGNGGVVTIEAKNYYASPRSQIDVSAGPNGVDGSIDISAINVDVVDKLLPLESNFADINSLLRPSCASVSRAVKNNSHLQVKHFPGLPLSPESLLLAFDKINLPAEKVSKKMGAVLREGMRALRDGQYQTAYERFSTASTLSAKTGNIALEINSLHALAQTQQILGRYTLSLKTLSRLLAALQNSNDSDLKSSVSNSLGNTYIALGKFDLAEKALMQALLRAKDINRASLLSVVWNNIGNLRALTQKPEQALSAYQASFYFARVSQDQAQKAKALANKARSALGLLQYEIAASSLADAAQLLLGLDESDNKINILIHLAKSYQQLARKSKRWREQALLSAVSMLDEAITLSRKTDNDYALSFAYGNMGALYRLENRTEEALYLTRQALQSAKRARSAEALYRWHWQEGRLLWAQVDSQVDSQGAIHGAIQAHRRAVEILEQNRQQVLTRYGNAAEYFDQIIAPVYRDYVAILLESEKRITDTSLSQSLLVEARATIEQFKVAELRDYFRNECFLELEAKATRLESVSATAAVVYPIVLENRLVLLVSLSGQIRQYDVGVKREEFIQSIRQFRFQLEAAGEKEQYIQLSSLLYSWLVKPYQQELENNNIDTLVFVPDGALRTIPLSALHDGEDYIVRRYSIVTSLGLSLTAPQPIDTTNASVLLAGVSQPTQGFEALPSVASEFESIARLFDTNILLNQDFTLSAFNSALETPRTIVHIASHAKFLPNVSDSFLLTFDDRLSIDQLSQSLFKTRYRQQALELLFLSACQTAANDDRAVLGLAGAGAKAGARSAIGSLWDISDNGASKIVAEFYTQLKNNNLSRAKALQSAQIALLDNPEFSHPFYWSSFILINNWL